MTHREHLVELFRYNAWANELISGAIPAQLLDVTTPSSFDTLRKTIYHIWDAQWIWLERVRGNSPTTVEMDDFNGPFEEAVRLLLEHNALWLEEIESRTDDELSDAIVYKNVAGKEFTRHFDEIVMHVCNHSTFHRGQAVTMLRALGVTSIPATDLSLYFNMTM